MHLDRYAYTVSMVDGAIQYEFFSKGPKGSIRKIIRFEKINDKIFNLSFGDYVSENEPVSDYITTNNRDPEKVLSTVAAVVMNFTELHPGANIFAQGSSPSRTRLYKICIVKHSKSIADNFNIMGRLINDTWEEFNKDNNYNAFLGIRKKQ